MQTSVYQKKLKCLTYDILEIGFCDYGYPTPEILKTYNWENAIDDKFEVIMNHVFSKYDDYGKQLLWRDGLLDTILILYPSDILFMAKAIVNIILDNSMELLKVYKYFFSILINESNNNTVPVAKMFSKIETMLQDAM